MERVHFIGIGGSGLSAIALVLLERGYQVSGSDRQVTEMGLRLMELGATISWSHLANNVIGADMVLRSSAIGEENVEVQAALDAKIPVYKRADFLEHLTGDQETIAVAGTHGKTTTTAMVAWTLTKMGQDPSYIIGGVSHNLAGNAHSGDGRYFVIEADEYDRMFLGLQPQIAIVTNIEHDHPDLFPTYGDFYMAFQEFTSRIRPGGVLIACGEDPGASQLMEQARKAGLEVRSYGVGGHDFDYCATEETTNSSGGYSFTSSRRTGERITQVGLQVPGEHNVRNALSVIALADVLNFPMEEVTKALNLFKGTGRRFEIHREVGGVVIVDDYAHHPTEIRATMSAARVRFPDRRLWAVWQPHTFSRTRTLFEAYLTAFEDADEVIVTEVYPARESQPVDGFSAVRIVEAILLSDPDRRISFARDLEEARAFLLEQLQPNDVLVVLSAGDADQLSARLREDLSNQETSKTS